MFKNTKLIAASAICATIVTVAAGSGPAEARNRGWETGAAAAGGFVAGAIIGSAVSQPRYYEAPRYYAPPPPPVYYAPRRPAPVYYGYRPAPWTPAWYEYCSARYRSFNPRTGYFVTYSGHHRFCQ